MPNKNAYQKIQEREELKRFNRKVANFIERWSPEDKYDSSYFSAELIDIVNSINAENTDRWMSYISKMNINQCIVDPHGNFK